MQINRIKGKDQTIKQTGPNPLRYVGVRFSSSGDTEALLQWEGGKWQEYSEIDDGASYRTGGVSSEFRGKGFQLAQFYREYDWVNDDGYDKFSDWVG